MAPSTPEITSKKPSTSSSHEQISPADTEPKLSSHNEDPSASKHNTEASRLHVVTTIIGLRNILGISGEHGITTQTHLFDEAKELADATGVSYKHMKMPNEDDEEGCLTVPNAGNGWCERALDVNAKIRPLCLGLIHCMRVLYICLAALHAMSDIICNTHLANQWCKVRIDIFYRIKAKY